MRIHYLQNDPMAVPGLIEQWATQKRHPLTGTRVYEGESFPALDSFDLLIILGGRMGAYEEAQYPWLIAEKAYIREAIFQNKFVLGICLGVQLMAEALGGKAIPHEHKEVGWWPIQLNADAANAELLQGLPAQFCAFQWHGDTFHLPAGAVLLAGNNACANQSFLYGRRALGVQFHPEVDHGITTMWTQQFQDDLKEGPFSQTIEAMVNQPACLEQGKEVMFTILNNFERCIDHEAASA